MKHSTEDHIGGLAMLTYDDVRRLFRAAGLPCSRSSVSRALKPRQLSYKTRRFHPDDVQAHIETACAKRKEAA